MTHIDATSPSPDGTEQDGPPSGVPEVRAVTRAISILRAFGAEKRFWALSELTRRSGLDKGTVRRILHTLRLSGLVAVHSPSQTYELTLGLLELASAIHRGTDLQTMARPYLSDLAEMVGGTAFLWVFERGKGVCLDRVSAPNSIITTIISAGNRTTLNCGAAPRVLLAYISEEERNAALVEPQAIRTAHSVTDPQNLRAIARTIRERGYEYVVDDFIIGLAALGVPIFSQNGDFVGAISVTNLTDRIDFADEHSPLLKSLQDAAHRLSIAPRL